MPAEDGDNQVAESEAEPNWIEWLLGAGRGLTPFVPGYVWLSYPGNWVKDQCVDYHGRALDLHDLEGGTKNLSLEEQLHRSAPADLIKLATQLAAERDAFVVRTVLLAKLPGWERCSLAGTAVTSLKAGICMVSNQNATSNANVVFKLLGIEIGGSESASAEKIVVVHRALSDAGVATTLLASGPDWTIEAFGIGRNDAHNPTNRGWMCAQNAELTVRLHAAPTAWWPPHQAALRKLLPILHQEPDTSALYTVAAFSDSKGRATGNQAAPVFCDSAEQQKLAELMAILPRPEGDVANRVVNVHGDLWDGNIVRAPAAGGEDAILQLMDLESTSVCGAVQDLIHVPEPELIEGYLRGVTGRDPSADEVDALLFEARLAHHIHFDILRGIFMINGGQAAAELPGSFIPHARRLAAVANSVRASAGLRRYVVRRESEDQKWCWWGAETLSKQLEANH
jgi:hypothetical protein